MAKPRNNRNPPIKASFDSRAAKPRWAMGILCLILGMLTALALSDYSPQQNPRFATDMAESNIIGWFGLEFSYNSILWIGVSAWMTPVILVWLAYMFFFAHSHRLKVGKLVSILVLIISASVFGSITQSHFGAEETISSNYFPQGYGGLVGRTLYDNLLHYFIGKVGSMVVFIVLTVFAVFFLLTDNLFKDISAKVRVWGENWAKDREIKAKIRQGKELEQQAKTLTPPKKELSLPQPRLGLGASKKNEEEMESEPLPVIPQSAKPATRPRITRQPFAPIVEADSNPSPEPEPFDNGNGKGNPVDAPAPTPASANILTLPKNSSTGTGTPSMPASGLRIIASEQTRKANLPVDKRKGDYVFPPYSMLTEPVVLDDEDSSDYHKQTAESLVRILDEFGVKVTMGEVHTGPVITRYDVYPAPGVRVEKIVNLDKNLALGLKAMSVRILAPVPGKGCVGIEVPNKHPQPVVIRDILESEDWVNTKAEIPIALGKEVSGKPMIADLTKMPHLLIAGSTGSGKTVCINSIITSLLYHASPEDLRFVMVDPKIVEMQVYNSLPHMLVPVVTDPKKVPNALKYLLNEMERRYHLFASIGVRNIAGYNAKMAKGQEAKEAEERAAELDAALTPEERAATANAMQVPRQLGFEDEMPVKLPYVVVVVDELADLMMVAPADIETGIARLAQLARAAGIHLILATQRPSVNVITGVIKANLPSRISFKVASKVDSRTILDGGGADQLIGRGDMLFLPPGSPELIRSQGAFVGDDEINNIVEFIRDHNGEPVFDEQFQRNIEEGDGEEEGTAEGEWDDDLVPQAIDVIRNSRRASTSMLQRRLKIGYNRAARIMEILEDKGMVGPENGSSPREILMDLD